MKSGWQTTEFWKGILIAVVNVGVAAGMISMSDQNTLNGAISAGGAAMGVIITNTWIVIKYIESRTDQKILEKTEDK